MAGCSWPLESDGGGCHQDPKTRHPGAPAKIQSAVVWPPPLVEKPNTAERLRGDQHGTGRHAENLTDPVVLSLVDLALLQGRVGESQPVGRRPDVSKELRITPVDDLGAHDAGPLHTSGGIHQRRDGVRRQDDVIVEQQNLPRSLSVGPRQGSGKGGRGSLLRIEPQDSVATQRGVQQLAGKFLR